MTSLPNRFSSTRRGSRRARLCFFAVLSGAASLAYGAPRDTELVSVTTDGTRSLGNSSIDSASAISADGRYVAFIFGAGSPGGPEGAVFVRDRSIGRTEEVSVGTGGIPANGFSNAAAISADGRYVVFSSKASNLVPDDTNGSSDVFVRDRQTGVTERVSVAIGDAEVTGGYEGVISADGRFVAFNHLNSDIFVRDRHLGVTRRVSMPAEGRVRSPTISADGRYIAYDSTEVFFLPDGRLHYNEYTDILLRDQQTGAIEVVASGGGHSMDPSISADGRYVAFSSAASFGLGFYPKSIFARDRQTGSIELVSKSVLRYANGESRVPSISADGRHVAYLSSTKLVPGDSTPGMYLTNRETGLTIEVSVDSNGLPGSASLLSPRVSASGDGRFVAFTYHGSDLGANDFNESNDVYVHEHGGSEPGAMNYGVQPQALAFGDKTLSTRTTRSFTLRNAGVAPLPILGYELRGSGIASFSYVSRCGASIAVGGSCSIDVTFTPTWVGLKTAELRILAGNNIRRDRQMSGTGVEGSFAVWPTSIWFGKVALNASLVRVVTIKNTATGVLPIKGIYIGGANRGQFSRTHNCPANLAVGGSCGVRVVFKPTSRGVKSATLTVWGGGGAGPKSVPLNGTGT